MPCYGTCETCGCDTIDSSCVGCLLAENDRLGEELEAVTAERDRLLAANSALVDRATRLRADVRGLLAMLQADLEAGGNA